MFRQQILRIIGKLGITRVIFRPKLMNLLCTLLQVLSRFGSFFFFSCKHVGTLPRLQLLIFASQTPECSFLP